MNRPSPIPLLAALLLVAPALDRANALSITPSAPAQAPAAAAPSAAPEPSSSSSSAGDPNDFEKANQLLATGDYAHALELLKTLNTRTPHNPEILYDLGLAEEALHPDAPAQPDAEADYRAAIAANPLRPLPHVALGLLLARSNRPEEAHTELTTALQIPDIPNEVKAQTLRALARLDLNSHNAASAAGELAEALQLTPETPSDTLLAAEIAVATPDLPAAESAYHRFLTTHPNDPSATAALAHVLDAEHRPSEAELLLTSALAQHPADPVLTAQLAATLLATDDPAKISQAAPLVEKLHTDNPSDPNIARLLARIYVATGHLDDADALYASLLAAPGAAASPTLLAGRAEVLIRLHRPAEAEALLKQAVQKRAAFSSTQDFGDAAMQLAFAAAEIDDPREVLRALDLRATVLPSSLASLFLEATARDQLHQSSQAADLYKKFLAEAKGTLPDQETQARQRLAALQSRK